MKVLLINPNRTFPPNSRKPTLTLPLGILYIAAVLEREGIYVSIYDCLLTRDTRSKNVNEVIHYGVDDRVLWDAISKIKPDIVGISVPFTVQISNLLHAAHLVRRALQDSFIVAGGAHFSVVDESFLDEYREIDCFISGEGEYSMLKLVKALETNSSLEKIEGLTYRRINSHGSTIIKKNPPKNILDLDSLPLPAYHMIDMNLFFRFQLKGLRSRPYAHYRAVSMITSRGCPFRCIFCSIHLHMGRKIRNHSVDYVLSHIDYLVSNYNIKHIQFEDDNLTMNTKRAQELFERLAKRNYKIRWDTPNGVRFDTLTYPLLKEMKKSGCVGLVVAPESGDQGTLDNIIKKSLKLENLFPVVRWCHELGITIYAFYLIGFPGETKEKIEKTLDFALSVYDIHDVIPMLSFAMPLLGTELYDIVVRNSYCTKPVTPKNLATARTISIIRTKDFTPNDLLVYRKRFNEEVKKIRLRKKAAESLTIRIHRFQISARTAIYHPSKIFTVIKRIVSNRI